MMNHLGFRVISLPLRAPALLCQPLLGERHQHEALESQLFVLLHSGHKPASSGITDEPAVSTTHGIRPW